MLAVATSIYSLSSVIFKGSLHGLDRLETLQDWSLARWMCVISDLSDRGALQGQEYNKIQTSDFCWNKNLTRKSKPVSTFVSPCITSTLAVSKLQQWHLRNITLCASENRPSDGSYVLSICLPVHSCWTHSISFTMLQPTTPPPAQSHPQTHTHKGMHTYSHTHTHRAPSGLTALLPKQLFLKHLPRSSTAAFCPLTLS